jgi:hypothetical protein
VNPRCHSRERRTANDRTPKRPTKPKGLVRTTTGHPVGDAVLPAALRLVSAVRAGNKKEILDAIASAQQAANNDYWMTALVIVLAGLVPEDATPSELLAWTTEESGAERGR